jgi:hypothetical protein
MEGRVPDDMPRQVWMQAVRPIPKALVGSVVIVWLTTLVVPGIHLDGPLEQQAQAIAVAALVFLTFAMLFLTVMLISGLRQVRRPDELQGTHNDDKEAQYKQSGLLPFAPFVPLILLITSMFSAPLALWLSGVLCAALGLPLRIDGIESILIGGLVVIVGRLLLGVAVKVAMTTWRRFASGGTPGAR